MGKCFDVLFASLTVVAAVHLWEWMSKDSLDTDFVDEGAASDCRCFGLDFNHDGLLVS